jgi:hypothetical protein
VAPDVIFFPHALLGPLDWRLVVAGKSLHPLLVRVRALAERFLVDHWNSHYVAKEVDHLLGPRQPAQVAVDDNAVKAAVNKHQQATKQLCEQFHRSSPLILPR